MDFLLTSAINLSDVGGMRLKELFDGEQSSVEVELPTSRKLWLWVCGLG